MQGQESQSAQVPVYVGIDVSKGHLDVYIHPIDGSFRVTNEISGWRQLKKRLVGLNVTVVVLEATAKYHSGVYHCLSDVGFAVSIVNPHRSRMFASASGVLAKTDTIDARMLALAGEALKLKATPQTPAAVRALQELVNTLAAFKADRTAVSNRLGASTDRHVKALLRRHLRGIDRHIEQLEQHIMEQIKADPILSRHYDILVSVPGIGPVVAVTLIAHLHELGTCSAKQIAALVGVAPMNWDSGLLRGKRRIRGGRAHVRKKLYMAAVTAVRSNKSDMKAFYLRLRDRGLAAKSALTAVIRKLAILANTLIAEDRKWQTVKP